MPGGWLVLLPLPPSATIPPPVAVKWEVRAWETSSPISTQTACRIIYIIIISKYTIRVYRTGTPARNAFRSAEDHSRLFLHDCTRIYCCRIYTGVRGGEESWSRRIITVPATFVLTVYVRIYEYLRETDFHYLSPAVQNGKKTTVKSTNSYRLVTGDGLTHNI